LLHRASLRHTRRHADRNDLFEYAKTVKETSPRLKKVILIHGEEDALNTFAERLRGELQLDVAIPQLGDTFALAG
jgi:predicted metal-dependent RNase